MKGFFLSVILVAVLIFPARASQEEPPPAIVDGVLDLRNYDFRAGNSVSLTGQWEFYWKELRMPGGFTGDTGFFRFPQLWNGRSFRGEDLTPAGFATYRLTILINAGGLPKMGITLEDVYTSYELFLNGNSIARNGQPGTTRQTTTPHWLPQTIPLDDLRESNELVLHIANFHHSKGGAKEEMRIGEFSQLAKERENQLTYDLILTGSLMMGGFFFLGLYLFGRHDKSMLFFSLFCIVYSYRIFGFGIYAFHSLLPDIDWIITTRLEYATLFLSAFLFGHYVLALYPDETNRKLFNFLSALSLIFIAVSLIFPSTWFTRLVEPFFVILLIYILYATYIYVRAAINKRIGANYALASTGIVFIVFIYNILVYFNLGPPQMILSFLGYIAFFFLQSLILSFRFSSSLKSAIKTAEKAAKAKSEFLSMMSHEIRTPMNAVIGLTNYLREDEPRNDQIETLDTLKFSAQHLLVIINDILDYSKIDAGKIQFDLSSIKLDELTENIYNTLQPSADAKQLKFEFVLDPSLPQYILCDSTRTSQVLMNLISNAIKFTKEGHVKVIIESIKKDNELATIKFSVEDTGIGIPENRLSAIFDEFSQAGSSITREFGGTGLGLTISRKLLKLQGSELKVESQFGKGSAFYFQQEFALSNEKAYKEQKHPVRREFIKLHDVKVLVVEDSPINVMVVSKFLTKWGIEVDNVENGKLAIERLSEKSYNLILMDLQMPVMDGYEAVAAIRKAGITTPIIALTASTMLEVKEKILESGMDGFVMKPFNPEELYREIYTRISVN